MAVIVTPAGARLEYKSKTNTFNITEISEFLEGFIMPVFIGETWIFVNKSAKDQGKALNFVVSETLGVQVYGMCLIAAMEELPQQFFVPELSKFSIQPAEPKDQVKFWYDNVISTYKQIFREDNISLEKAFENLKILIYEKKMPEGAPKVSFPAEMPDFESIAKEIIKKLIEHFSSEDIEEYEKCAELMKLKEYIDNL